MIKIELLYFENCPNYPAALDRLKAVLHEEGLTADVKEIEVEDQSTATRFEFLGSPTIRVNGLDIEVEARSQATAGLACRRYSGGLPSKQMIRAALREALQR